MAALLAFMPVASVYAGNCGNPTAPESTTMYNTDYHIFQYCNGSSWKAMGGLVVSSTVLPSAGSGYFVMSHDTYDGNLGGRAGADAKCLTDLTTNTGWKGYATANANGKLVASKVHALLCDSSSCTNLMPLTTYYFANAETGQGSAGGASFTTDSGGLGPNDSNSWAAANYFAGTYAYWMNMGTSAATLWSGTNASGVTCSGWTTGGAGAIANSASTNATRWNSGSNATCTVTQKLVCFVNP